MNFLKNFFNKAPKRQAVPNSARSPLPPQVASLLRESWWLLGVVAAIYLVLILLSYQPTDPGWSHSATRAQLQNRGGEVGAWVADMLLYLFGMSAWWWVAFCVSAIWWGYKRIDRVMTASRPVLVIGLVGFLMMLVASSGIEALRMHSLKAALPMAPGGLLGAVVGGHLHHVFGFTGATLVMLTLMAIGFSLFSGMSWLTVMEKLGGAIEDGYFWVVNTIEAWQDRKIGAVAKVERQEKVKVEKKKQEEAPPIHIEPQMLEVPVAKKVEKAREEEKQKEIQPVLFDDLPVPTASGELPPLALLAPPPPLQETVSHETLEYTSRLIERKLADFGVEVKVVAAYPGPVITRYEIEPAIGVKGAQIVNLMKDLARALSLVSIRVVETIPGKTYMGLELPNPKRQMVRLSEILSSEAYAQMHSHLCVALGKDIAGKPVVADLGKMPHLLVAGTTGSGKSVGVNTMILSMLYKAAPQDVRFIMVDPKMLELSIYEGIPHLLAPVVTDMKLAANALNWCVAEMEKRYRLMSAMGVRNIAGYNQKLKDAEKAGKKITNPFSLTPDDPEPLECLPFIVVVVDEFADLMMVAGKKIEELIARLAQKARAAGIHLVLATQRPSVDVITGLIKANIPTRMAFQVSSKVDSRTILDQMGAESLLGQGDMLFLPPGTGYPQRVHGAFCADEEVHKVVEYLKQTGEPNYVEGILTGEAMLGGGDAAGGAGGEGSSDGEADPLYDEAVAIVIKTRRASISAVQRHLRIGYNRAARLIEQMEAAGLVSPMESNGNRTVLAPNRDNE
ncbi:DNA translocase FtsK 4TM domain-containing protein [Chitinivorax sp. PXF-14]|uniref:DNA translocase FtsK n=1 Tax=Chitinivorax sp. PXF-14 TaxID=3230488 RepID=UPI00346797D5